MIRSKAIQGIAFGTEADGDGRSDVSARIAISNDLGIPSEWATISQVHGAGVVVATKAGPLGEADAVVTSTQGLPIAVATADCVPVGLAGDNSVALAHGSMLLRAADVREVGGYDERFRYAQDYDLWLRLFGSEAETVGVVPAVLESMRASGDPAARAVVGPHIGPCCYEVGDEVVAALVTSTSTTRWGTQSVDLASAIVEQLGEIEVEMIGTCTLEDDRFASYRRNATNRRQVAVAWLP